MRYPNGFPIAIGAALSCAALFADTPAVDVSSYASLQEAIDKNPGRILKLPGAEYVIDSALVIRADGTEIYGPARIVQSNPAEAMFRVNGVKRVKLSGLSLTRSEGRQQASQPGVDINECEDITVSGVRVTDNHAQTAIRARDSKGVTVQDCVIVNYKGPVIDDRTAPVYQAGFAFKAIDGTGIQFLGVEGGAIRNNRIREDRLRPTRELRDKLGLGQLTVVPKEPGLLMDKDIFEKRYTNNWHQGAAIQVSGPTKTRRIIITGNVIDHPAQGLDLHCDNVTVTSNIITNAMIGMKAMHGAKHVLIDGNQFAYVDLWGLLLMPGALSRTSAQPGFNGTPPSENVDGGTVVSNNIFSNFGFGDQYWNWIDHKNDYPERNAIVVLMGQIKENPPIRDILITGNVVHDSGRDTVLIDGKWEKVPPRYFYALYVEQTVQPAPVNVHVEGNVLDAGMTGVTNFPLDSRVVN